MAEPSPEFICTRCLPNPWSTYTTLDKTLHHGPRCFYCRGQHPGILVEAGTVEVKPQLTEPHRMGRLFGVAPKYSLDMLMGGLGNLPAPSGPQPINTDVYHTLDEGNHRLSMVVSEDKSFTLEAGYYELDDTMVSLSADQGRQLLTILQELYA